MCLKMMFLFCLVGYVGFLEDICPMKTQVFSISIVVLPAEVVFETEKLPPTDDRYLMTGPDKRCEGKYNPFDGLNPVFLGR